MKFIKALSVLFVMALILTSCSKEKRLERELRKQENWNIETLAWVKTTQVVDGEEFPEVSITSGVSTDAGFINFFKNDDGYYEYELDNGIVREKDFKWEVEDENTVSIGDGETSILEGFAQIINSGINGEDPEFNLRTEAFAYELTKGSGGTHTIEGAGVIQAFTVDDDILSENYTYVITMTIKED